MSVEKTIYLTDRSAVETDDACGMRFWLNRKEGPEKRGIVSKTESFHLMVGRTIHEDFAALATVEDLRPPAIQELIDDLLRDITAEDRLIQSRMEVLYRRLGWIAGWSLYIEPTIRENWDNVSVEGELILDREPLWVAVTPDRVLQNKKNPDILKYLEYKTTRSASKQWLDSWRYQIQIHTSLAAVQEELGKPVKYAMIAGLMKGYESPAENHRLIHPYTWAYYNESENKWTHKYTDARSSAWVQMPVWEYPGGIVEWVQKCGEDTAKAQFPHTPPIFLDERMLEEWIARRLFRERQIKGVEEVCRKDLKQRSLFFERRTSKCKPAYGDACPYLPICWNASAQADPASHPDFEPRKPHHDVELLSI